MDLDELLGIDPQDPAQAEASRDVQEFTTLIESLVRLRKDQGLTQKDVAEAMGTTQSAVSDIESIAGDPRISTVQRYARAVRAMLGFRLRFTGSATAEPVPPVFRTNASSAEGPMWHAPMVIVGGATAGRPRHGAILTTGGATGEGTRVG